MELMLPLKYVTDQDKRALTLYFAIALFSAACIVFFMLYKSDFHFGKKMEAEQLSTPIAKPTPRNR